MRIKVLSLWQPHAWAMYQGVKIYDTRSKEFMNLPGVREYRGPLAIHSAQKKFNPLAYQLCSQLAKDGLESPKNLVYGAVLCVVDLVAIHRAEDVRCRLSPRELLYGDYSDGRFALETTNLRQLAAPESLVGRQGMFYWDVSGVMPTGLSLVHCQGHVDMPACYCPHTNGKPKHTSACSSLRKRMGASANKKARCPNAGMEWLMQGLSTLAVRLCSQCCQTARKAHPNVTFKYVRREEAA